MTAKASHPRSLHGIYILSFMGVVVPFSSLAGAVWASFINDDDGSRVSSHCRYLLDSYWISILMNLGFLVAAAIGYAVARQQMDFYVVCLALTPALIFYLYRIATGYLRLQGGR
jgi:uncharacterized membrane protein